MLELVLVDVQHDVAVHLDEAAVRVLGKAAVAGLALQALDRVVVHAQVQDRVHHAGHRELRARAHRDQQRIVGVAQLLAHEGLELAEPFFELALDLLGQRALALRVDVARLG